MDLGNFIKTRRKELGLTLEEVGKAVGVGKSTVLKWESGYISNMRRDKIALLAKVLQLEPTALLDESETAPEPKQEKPALKLNDHEETLVLAYRANPAMQEAVDKLLGIEDAASIEKKKDA